MLGVVIEVFCSLIPLLFSFRISEFEDVRSPHFHNAVSNNHPKQRDNVIKLQSIIA